METEENSGINSFMKFFPFGNEASYNFHQTLSKLAGTLSEVLLKPEDASHLTIENINEVNNCIAELEKNYDPEVNLGDIEQLHIITGLRLFGWKRLLDEREKMQAVFNILNASTTTENQLKIDEIKNQWDVDKEEYEMKINAIKAKLPSVKRKTPEGWADYYIDVLDASPALPSLNDLEKNSTYSRSRTGELIFNYPVLTLILAKLGARLRVAKHNDIAKLKAAAQYISDRLDTVNNKNDGIQKGTMTLDEDTYLTPGLRQKHPKKKDIFEGDDTFNG